MGAMHLHGRFRDADIVGDLLIQATGCDADHDLTLAGAEAGEALSECPQSLITLQTSTITSEASLDSIKQVLITERRREKLYGTALHRLHAHRYVGVRCHKDDRDLPLRRDQLPLKLETALSRQSHVEHEAGGTFRRISLEKIGNRRKLARLQPDRSQQTHN